MAEPLDEPLTPADAPEIPGTAMIDVPVASTGLSVYDGPAIDIAAELRTSYLGYAMSTIVSRALPDVRDGLKPVQRRILYAMRELGLSPNSRHLKSAKVVGECFVAGTRVATPNGLRRIEDLQIGDTVFTQSGVRSVTEAYVLPAQPLLDVELGSGRNVFCTPGQQFKVLTSDLATVWKRADELQSGDIVVTRSNTVAHSTSSTNPLVDGITFDEDMAYLLGFFLADGWVDRDNKRGYHRVAFAAVERVIIERLQSILSRKFGILPAITERGNMYYLRIHDSALNKRILSAFDLQEKRADTITVPEALFSASSELVHSFVSGFVDGDGSVHKSRNIMVLTSIARPFLHDLSVLLFAHGIHSRLVPYDKVAGNTEYALEIGSRSLHALGKYLTLSHPVKAERLAAILERNEYQPEKAANVPYLGALLIAEFREKHLGGGWYSNDGGNKVRSGLKYADGTKIRYSANVADTFTVSMDALNTVGLLDKMTAVGSRYLPQIQEWQKNGIAFHAVKSVRPSMAQVTYDIQVEEEHEFVANGMIVHNCMGNFHPHGDQALYGTMVRMAQPFSLRYPMVDGQGNFGSVDDDPPAAMRYCLTGDSRIVTSEGLVPIGAMATTEDISASVLSLDGKVNTASKWFDCGKFPVRTVRTRRGYEVTGTTNHPLLVCVPDGDKRTTLVWKTIADLHVGDYVVLDRSETLWSDTLVDLTALHPELPERSRTEQHDLPARLDENGAFLLGALVAEGTCRPSCIEFCNLPGDFANAFVAAWAKVFPSCRLHTFHREPSSYGKKPFLQMQVVSQHVIAFLNALGLHGKSSERLVPESVFRSPQAVMAKFLQGLFEGDGAVERSGRSLLRVNLCAKNRAILQQVQTLLLRFGIVSTLNAETKCGTHRLLILGEDNLRRFAEKIGFASAAKSDALVDALATYTSGRVLSQTDFVPFLAEFVRERALRGNREWLDKNNFDRPERLEKALPRLAQALPTEDFAHVAQLSRNRYLFEPVVAIEDAGEQNVYSIRVDSDCHSFVANGFINHNTEARLTAVAMEMMEDIEKDTVNFQPTYDNERREPTVLPGKFPYLLCNGGSGIAVGMATNMPPHNLREICDASAFLLEHPEATVEQLMQYVPGPDFPTAGLILGSKGIKAAYHTGRGQVTMQAKTTIEPMGGGKSVIVISELPYQVIKKRLEEQIGDLVKEKKIDGITAVRDYSDKSGMRLVVELRRDVMPQKILNYLLKHTPLRLNFGVMMISLTEGGLSPKTLSLKTILQEYLDHRRDIITRRTRFELARAKARAHILEGLQIAVQFLDEVIAIIRGSSSTEMARTRLIDRFSFSGLQAEAILNMQLRQLTSLEQDKIEGEFKDLLKEIARFEDILMDPRRVNAMIKADLKYLKDKFGDDRRTKIIPTEAEEINIEDLIADEQMLITITRDGYIKRLDFDTFRSQRRGGRGVSAGKTREEDNFEHLFRASTHDYILFFTDRGRVYRLKAFEVPQSSRQAMGTAVINLIQIQPDEKITATVPIRDFRTAEGFLLMVTERGEIKRTAVAEYANLRANGLMTFDLEEGDSLKWVKHTPGVAEVILTTVRGMAIRFPEDKVPSRGRAAGGVRGITLDGAEDHVVSADVVIGDADAQELLVISELGLGKRTSLAEYRSQNRGGKGLKTMNLTDKTGCLVVATVVSKESEPHLRLMIVTENGVMIRMKAEEIKTTINRSTQGVRLINLGEGDRVKTAEVIDVAKVGDDVEG